MQPVSLPVLPKVALDYRPALLSPAGIGRAVRELARALAARGRIELHLFGHCLARAKVAVQPPAGAHLHRLPIPGRSLPWLRRCGLGADRLAGGAGVFHWTDYVQPPVARSRAALTIHDLAFLHDASWHGDDAPVLQRRTEQAAAAARVLIVPSQATADDVRRFLPQAPTPHIAPFGSDHVPAGPLPRPRDLPADYVLALGTIEPRKNHRALLAALRLLPPPRPLLVVVGGIGWACADIVADLLAAERDGLARWHRRADDAQVFALLQHARALAYPSLWEGFGFPPLEAMALGVPVVAHDAAPLRELTDGHALLVDAHSPAALADALARALGDADLRRRLHDGGRARAATFRWDDCAARHERAYAEALA